MRIISWNVNGIKARLDEIMKLLADYAPDVLCLLETKTNIDPHFEAPDGYETHFNNKAEKKGSGGIALICKKTL